VKKKKKHQTIKKEKRGIAGEQPSTDKYRKIKDEGKTSTLSKRKLKQKNKKTLDIPG